MKRFLKCFFDVSPRHQAWGSCVAIGVVLGIVAVILLHLPMLMALVGFGIVALLVLFSLV